MNSRAWQDRVPLAAVAACASLCVAALLLSTWPARSTAAPNPATEAQAVQIKTAWIRWLPGGVPLAGYATLANVSDQPSVLTSATSAAFHDLSLHQTLQTGGAVRMSPLERISIAPHSTLDFQARGIHLMLMQPLETLDPHGQVPITLHFADGSSLAVQFQVRSSVEDPPRA
jgi:periplasmic copper chaperone A